MWLLWFTGFLRQLKAANYIVPVEHAGNLPSWMRWKDGRVKHNHCLVLNIDSVKVVRKLFRSSLLSE